MLFGSRRFPMKKAIFLLLVFATCWFGTARALAESPDDILVIVNKAFTLKSVSEGELRDIFLRRKETWSNGLRAVPVHAKNAQLREDFSQRLLNMNRAEESLFWQQYQIKTGKSQPASFENTLKAVFKLEGAVSYVYRSQYRHGVANIVFVLPAS